MIRVYSAADPADAQLVRALLKGNHIEAVVQGEDLWVARGELPITPETAPSVWVHDGDAQRARALIEERQQPRTVQKPPWTCPSCGEQVEGQFSECWRCTGPAGDAPT